MSIWDAGTNVLDRVFRQGSQTIEAALRYLVPTSAGSTLSLSTYLQNNVSFNVLDQGAVADGVTDNYAAIVRSINLAKAVHGVVRFPASGTGVYLISQPLPYYSYMTFEFDSMNGVTLLCNSPTAFVAGTKGVAPTSYVKFIRPAMYYNGIARTVGTVGIDLSHSSYCQVAEASIRNFETGVLGREGTGGGAAGYYNMLFDCEIASCTYGVDLQQAANSWKILGGRLFSCTDAGVRLADVVTAWISTAVEHCYRGMHFMSGAVGNTVMGCHFEASDTAAIYYEPGAMFNRALANEYSNGTDRVVDMDGRNGDMSGRVFGLDSPQSSVGGKNLLANGDFTLDTNADGLADGWEILPTVPAGLTFALDNTTRRGGGGTSQKFTIASGGTSERAPSITVPVQAGEPHVMTGWVRVDQAGAWGLKIGNTLADNAYMIEVLDTVGRWQHIRQTFVPTGDSIVVYLFMRSFGAGVARNVWVDKFQVQHGSIPTAFQG